MQPIGRGLGNVVVYGFYKVGCVQRCVEIVWVQPNGSSDAGQYIQIVDGLGLLPIGFQYCVVKAIAQAQAFGIFDADQGGSAVDAKGAGVYFQAIVPARSFIEFRASRFDFGPIGGRDRRRVAGAQLVGMPLDFYVVGCL